VSVLVRPAMTFWYATVVWRHASLPWRRSVSDILGLLREPTAPDARLVFVGSQPIRSIPAFDTPLAFLAAAHRTLLNGIAEKACGRIAGASFITLPGSDAS